jgi:parvulin-like peptidyl-prolyl isomerase
MIAAKKAKDAGLDKERSTQLQLGFQQSRILANEYGKRHQKELEVSKEEVAKYLKEHPEFDPKGKREKAEQVLQRAKSGEDFAKLANEFSEDPGNRDPQSGQGKGGLYENVKKGMFVPQFEAAALALQPGQVSDLVETQFGYHIIKLESKGMSKDKDGKEAESYNVRHILIGTTFSDPTNPYAQPMPLDKKVEQEAQQAKIEKFIEEIVARNKITLPAAEEIKLNVPPMPENPMMQELPPGMEEPPAKGKTEEKGKATTTSKKK